MTQEAELSGLYNRKCLILLYSLELLFHRKDHDSLFAEILTRVVSETALYEAWLRACLKGDRLDDILASGTHLMQHLELYKLHSEAHEVLDEFWTLFCQSLGRPEREGDSTYQLFLGYRRRKPR